MRTKLFIISLSCMFALTSICAQNETVIASDESGQHKGDLMEIEMNGGKPFMDVLRDKEPMSNISSRNLEPHHLSGLFRAANGIPRRGEIHNRTAYAPMEVQCVKMYVIMREGLFLYDAEPHKLKQIAPIDYRLRISDDNQVHRAPIVVIYVLSNEIGTAIKEENKLNYAYLQSGSICQNINLYCSSEDMATNVYLDIKRDELAKKLNVKPTNILFGQAIGYRE